MLEEKEIKRIYLDNAATTKVDEEVINAMKPFFNQDYGNASSLHSEGQKASIALEESREKIAKAIGAQKEEIFFTSGGSESNNLALFGVMHFLRNKKSNKDHLIVSRIEHPSVLNVVKRLEEQGFLVDFLNVDKEGIIDLNELNNLISERTALISVMHANNEIGSIQPIKEISKICKEHDVIFHSDAVQSFTKIPLNVKKTEVDLISFSAHKIYGPKGIGALYIRNGVKLIPLIFGGGQENGLRAGTENIPGIVGFAKAVEISNKIDYNKMTELRNYLIERILNEVSESKLNGSRNNRLPNNANFAFKFVEGEAMILHLDARGIAASTGSACSSKSLKASHVLRAIKLSIPESHGSLRLTLSKDSSKQEIDYTVEKVKEVVELLRKISTKW